MAVGDPPDQAARLERELAAARRTIDVLMDRVEQPALSAGADRFVLLKTIAGLQDEVRQASRRSERSAAHYRALYEQSPDAVLTIGPDGRLSDCNRTAEQLFGRPREVMRGANLSALLEPSSGAALTTLLWSGFAGVGESDVALPDGRRLSFSVARLEDVGWLMVLRDVTRHHELDQELMKSRRLASVGRLAASVAHEINAPLSLLHGRLQLLSAGATVDPNLERQLLVAHEQVARIEGLVRNLQTFAVHRLPEREWVTLQSIFDGARAAVPGRARRLRLIEDIEPADLRVRADPGLVQQMVVNLLRQAADDCPPGGELVLRARPIESGVRVTVSGESLGLPDELLEMLRSPYSGRHMDPALGLHLAIAWAIAQDHDGWMTAENQPSGGAAFHVTLPDFAPTVAPQASDRSLRVLVVDDDQLLCETITWMLVQDGHRIASALSAEEALDRLGREPFDVVVTDYLLPGMSGEALIEVIARRWPKLARRTLLTSGLLHTPARGGAYLQKPFTQAQLVAIVRNLAAQGGQLGDST